MLTTDMQREPVKTLEEILERNYTVVVMDTFTEIMQAQICFANDSR